LITADFAVNNKTYSVTKVFPLIINYRRKLRIGVDIRRKGKIEKVTEFAKRMKKVQEEAKVVLKKAQKEMKYQADKRKIEVEK